MANRVTGFLANDGSFHETEAEADFRDAEDEIRQYCVTHTPNQIDDNALLEYVEALADPIYRYLNAKDRIDVEAARKNTEATVGEINKEASELWIGNKDARDEFFNNYFGSHPIAEVLDSQVHQADDSTTEEELAALLQQPTDGHEPVPDVGSGASAEGVLDKRASYGPRSGQRDARGFRSGETVAVEVQDGIT